MMKNIGQIIIVVLLWNCFSCEEIEDNYKKYTTETVYPGKADSLRTYIGIEKVYLAWEKPTDVKTQKMVIKYSEKDSIISETIIDTIVVSGLDSGDSYTFEIFSIDSNLNQSVKEYVDLLPVSQDWISKNITLPKPQISPTDGVNIEQLTFSWVSLNDNFKVYKDGLEYTFKDSDGNIISTDITEENNVTAGNINLTLSNLDPNKTYTLSYKMTFSPRVDNKTIIDTAVFEGQISFVPNDFSLAPIYLLVRSIGWDDSSFITMKALEPGKYIAKNITLEEDDVYRAFEEASTTSEKQFGFSFFNTTTSLAKVSDDGNDNIQLTSAAGVYDIIIETISKNLSSIGTYDGLIQIPGKLEAENFNVGGHGVAYSDVEARNRGGAHRNEGVDIGSGPSGNFNVGYTRDGEWLIYTVNVQEAGNYKVDFSVASPRSSPGQLVISFDGAETLVFQCINTGGWGSFQTQLGGTIPLKAGIQQLRIDMRDPGMNVDGIIFTKQ